MAALNQSYLTLVDQIKRRDPNGAIAAIVEQMAKRNTFLEDMTFVEGNLPTGNRFTSRNALPTLGWRRMNEGIAASKSQTNQIDEACGQLEGMSVVDRRLAMIGGDAPAFRQTEDLAFMQAMPNEVESRFFYGSFKTNPEIFQGLAPRMDSTTNPQGGSQILKHDGSASGSDQTSIWLVVSSPQTVFAIYPKGSTGGVSMTDMGEQLWDDGTGKKFIAYVSNWNWQVGLCVRDFRYVYRIANVDTSNLVGTGNALIQSMVSATHLVQDLVSGTPRFYVNRTVGRFLHLQALDSVKNSTLSVENVGGRPVTTLLGIPVRETDSLLNNEAIIS